ncbi:glutathione hydrolase 1 proenzyme-like [Drosophila innubila]|uniref:glutathione hydrolase 1 proenzyme-like n=1 Tax=Drosophila innubila TaxID=198719 RepID=UPI00148D7D2D|nr:glutathione hydrolase 1 proenzyme-like [Drosophila innubila]
MLCNGLNTLENLGIGGGLMMNIYDRSNRKAYFVDAKSSEPVATDPNMEYIRGVPGEVMGYHIAHQRFGRLPWRELVEPSLRVCQTGFIMNKNQETLVREKWDNADESTRLKLLRNFVDPESGKPYEAGSLLMPSEKLCNTYQLLADNGPMDFYNGTVAKMLAEDLKELGSIITRDDLDAYSAEMRLSITMPLGQDTLYAVPPVSSGSVVSHVLSILEGFNFTRADLADDESYALTVHRITEALKFGFARRLELRDPRSKEVIKQLNTPEYAAQQRAKINDNQALLIQYNGYIMHNTEDPYSTSDTTVIAPNGDAVAATSSINSRGSFNVIGQRTGISLNIARSRINEQHLRSQSPILLTDHEGNIRLAVAVDGESDTVEVIARILWFNEDVKTAVEMPRFHNFQLTNLFNYEDGLLSNSVLSLLYNRGVRPRKIDPIMSSACAIERNATAIYASAVDRKGGGVAGF